MKILIFTLLLFLTACSVRLTDDKKNALKRELENMVETDQVAAYIPQGKYKSYSKEEWNHFKDSVFTSHTVRVERIFNRYGFPGFDKVGKDGSNHFWLLVQHSDKYPSFQKRVLKAMDKEVKKENANAGNYAYLYDRVEVNAGQKQLFGTQVTYEVNRTGRAILKNGLIDSVNVDKRRKEYGLEPLVEYLNSMTGMHYEMNKERYEQMGVKSADLYR